MDSSLLENRLLLLLLALPLSGLVGMIGAALKRVTRISPAALAAKLLRTLEKKLNRERRDAADRRRRGLIVMMTLMLLALALGLVFTFVLGKSYYGGVIIVALLAWLLPAGEMMATARHYHRLLARGYTEDARDALANTPWRNRALLDSHGMVRAGIENMAVTFSDRIVAPAIWFLMLGLPGLLASRLLGSMAETWHAHRDFFGSAAVRAHSILHSVPSWVAAMLLTAAASFTPFARQRGGLTLTFAQWNGSNPYASAIAATATGLSLALGGPLSVYVAPVWLGQGTPKAEASDMARAVQLAFLSLLLLLTLLGLLWLALGG